MFDIVVLVILGISTALAWSRGFVREFISIVGWIFSLLIAVNYGHLLMPYVQKIGPISAFLKDNCEILSLISFVVSFIIMMILSALLVPFFSGMVKGSFLESFDNGLGALFGFARGIFIMLLFLMLYDGFLARTSPWPSISNSTSYGMFSGPKASLQGSLPTFESTPSWVQSQFDKVVTKGCKRAPTPEESAT